MLGKNPSSNEIVFNSEFTIVLIDCPILSYVEQTSLTKTPSKSTLRTTSCFLKIEQTKKENQTIHYKLY